MKPLTIITALTLLTTPIISQAYTEDSFRQSAGHTVFVQQTLFDAHYEFVYAMSGTIQKEETQTWTLQLDNNTVYRIVAVSEDSITDLDIIVNSERGVLVAQDNQKGNLPTVEFKLYESQSVSVQVKAYDTNPNTATLANIYNIIVAKKNK